MENHTSARLMAFFNALPHARDEEFVNAPGLGVFRAKFVRRGLDKGVLAEHWTGLGLAIVQPDTHGACGFCKGRKGSQPCEHCACAMCSWFRQADERASPRISQEKLLRLVARLKTFEFGGAPKPTTVPMLDEEVL